MARSACAPERGRRLQSDPVVAQIIEDVLREESRYGSLDDIDPADADVIRPCLDMARSPLIVRHACYLPHTVHGDVEGVKTCEQNTTAVIGHEAHVEKLRGSTRVVARHNRM